MTPLSGDTGASDYHQAPGTDRRRQASLSSRRGPVGKVIRRSSPPSLPGRAVMLPWWLSACGWAGRAGDRRPGSWNRPFARTADGRRWW